MEDDDEELLDTSVEANAKEGARELARLRYNGALDTFLGVDKFWNEKWLLLLSCAQDFALLWLFPIQWPWHFWRRTHFMLYTVLDFDTIRNYEIPACTNCSIPTPYCASGPTGCYPILPQPSTLYSKLYIFLGTTAFILWLSLTLVPDLGLIGPALARNVERISCPLLSFFYLPVLLKTMYTVCDYQYYVVEKWECKPTVPSLLWSLPAAVFILGYPAVLIRRITFQTLYNSSLRHETYIRTRELEYMLKLGTVYRDKRLWLMSSFTRAGRFTLPWYLVQKLLIVSLLAVANIPSIKNGNTKYEVACLGAAVIAFPTLLFTLWLRCYRVGSSHLAQLLLYWALTFYAGWGFITLCGARLVTEKQQGQAMQYILLIVFLMYMAGLVVMYYISHDFSMLLSPGSAIKRERAKGVTATRMREENKRHLHLGKSLKGMILDMCRAKLSQGRVLYPSAGGNTTVTVEAVVAQPFDRDNFISDFILFGETSLSEEDIKIVSAEPKDDCVVVRLVLSSKTIDTRAVAAAVCRKVAEGALLKEALGAISLTSESNIVNEVTVPCKALVENYASVFTLAEGVLISHDVAGIPDVPELRDFISREVVAVGDRDVDQTTLLQTLEDLGDQVVWLYFRPEVPTAPTFDPEGKDVYSVHKGDYELEMLQSLLKHRLTQAELFSASDECCDEVNVQPSYYLFPPSASVQYMWPVSQALVGEIKRENQTNRFLDVLREANAMLMEVSFLHATPELIRTESLLFHIQRVTKCYHACQRLRVTHHLNAIHPLAPTFEATLEQLVHEYKVNRPKSLTVGRRAFVLPVVSAYLHHRMNQRARYFSLLRPVMLRVLFKLLVLRMFVQLVSGKEELLPARLSVVEEEAQEVVEQSANDFAKEAFVAVRRRSTFYGIPDMPQAQLEVTEVVVTEAFAKTVDNMAAGETIYRAQLEQEEAFKRNELTKDRRDVLNVQRGKEQKHHAKQAAARQACGREESTAREKIASEEHVEWKAWEELSGDLMKDVRAHNKWQIRHTAFFNDEASSRGALAEEEDAAHAPLMQKASEAIAQLVLEEKKLHEMRTKLQKQKEAAQQSPEAPQQEDPHLDVQGEMKSRKRKLGKQLNEWKEGYKAEHGKYPTKAVLGQHPVIGKVYKEYMQLKAQVQSASPTTSPVSTPTHVASTEPGGEAKPLKEKKAKKGKKDKKEKQQTTEESEPSSKEPTPLTLPSAGGDVPQEEVVPTESPSDLPQKSETQAESTDNVPQEGDPKYAPLETMLDPEPASQQAQHTEGPQEAHDEEPIALQPPQEGEKTEKEGERPEDVPVKDNGAHEGPREVEVPKEAEVPEEVEVGTGELKEEPREEPKEEEVPKEEAKEEEVTQEEPKEEDVPKEDEPKEAVPREEPNEEEVPEEGAVSKEEIVSKEADLPQEVPKEEEVQEESREADVPKEGEPKEDTPREEVALEETAPQETPTESDVGSPPTKEKKKKKGRKAELVKMLNEWKAKYNEEHGKEPTKGILRSDPSISEVYSEYVALQKTKSPEARPTPAPEGVPSEGSTSYEAMPLSELKSVVKSLVEKLNAWKEDFASKHEGKQPTKSDIKKASEISETYDAYTKASSTLKKRKAS